MAELLPTNELVVKLMGQLAIARNEINNLRQQVKSLTHMNRKKVKQIEEILSNWRCRSCQQSERALEQAETDVSLQPIGTISTDFINKRGIPRQPMIGRRIQGKIKLNNKIFTNPDHSLEGLEEFSHLWVLFHFHNNASNRVMAKVSPPRLNGIRKGVFSTRSPHRPSPIGLSLVQINHIDGATIYFSGVDMLDGTPVLDIKPYIPSYDNPLHVTKTELAATSQDDLLQPIGILDAAVSCTADNVYGEREAPDGEESDEQVTTLSVNVLADDSSAHQHIVRVPLWVSEPPVSQLTVTFSPNVEEEIESNTKDAITTILKEDPRSVYLRERYGNQFYTFLIKGLHVSCKFDDSIQTVNVYRIALAKSLCCCGILKWQCPEHQSEAE